MSFSRTAVAWLVWTSLAASLAGAQPPNDNCSNASTLTNGVQTTQSISGATVDGPPTISCTGASVSQDHWFRFTALRSGTATVLVTFVLNGLERNLFAEVYSGTCGSLGAPIACRSVITNTASMQPTVTAGTTYLLRVGVAGFTGAWNNQVTYVDPAPAAAPTAITYQGRLLNSGTPVNGPRDLSFKLFDAPTFGVQVGSTLTLNAVNINNGLFTVPLDFGSVPFGGIDRWMEIGVGATTLSPRQQITPAPLALFAANAAQAASATSAATAVRANNGGSGGVSVSSVLVGSMNTVAYSSSSFIPIAQSVNATVTALSGTGVLVWSLTGSSTANGIYEVRANINGAPQPPMRWTINQANVHASISGSLALNYPGSAGLGSVQLEVRSVNGGTLVQDPNDSLSWTFTVHLD